MTYYIFGVVVCLVVDIFVWLTCWFWAGIAAVLNLEALPRPFDLLHTHDDDIYGSGTTKEPRPKTVWRRWLRATWWMFRNPGYGVQARIFGIPALDVLSVTSTGTDITRGIHDSLLLVNDDHAFGYRRDILWSGTFYCKVWTGWNYRRKGGYHILKFDFNPFKRRSKR